MNSAAKARLKYERAKEATAHEQILHQISKDRLELAKKQEAQAERELIAVLQGKVE